MSKTTTQEPTMSTINFTINFNRTINGVTSTATAFSNAATYNGAILDAKVQTRRADRLSGESATYQGFIAHPAQRVLA
jgi:hypothetical protein